MRILVISNLLPPRILGGYEQACWRISKALRERGHEVLVLTSPTDRTTEEDQSFVDRALSLAAYLAVPAQGEQITAFLGHQSKVSAISNTLIVLDRLRRFRPDHALVFNLVGLGGLAIVDLLDHIGVPWTFNLGDRVPGVLVEEVAPAVSDVYRVREIFRSGRVSSVSERLVREIEIDDGIPLGDRRAIIPRGVLGGLTPHRRVPRAGGITRFTGAGALYPFKGVDLIIDAAAELKRRGTTGFRVDVFGEGDREHVERAVRDRDVADLVSFPGQVSRERLLAEHAEADAFLFPTWEREPGASAPYEAMSAGAPPIITATSGPAEQLRDGIDCIKIERSALALADAMEAVIDGRVNLDSLREHGRFAIEERLSFERSIDRTEELMSTAPGTAWAESLDLAAVGARSVDLDRQATKALYRVLLGVDL